VTLTARQRRAIEALLVAGTVEGAATRAGVHRTTLFRWLADATFCDELRRREALLLDEAMRILQSGVRVAAAHLISVIADPGAPYGVKVRADEILLSKALTWRELHELEARLAALEQRLRNGHRETTSNA
jgi:hypothetical protein